MKVNGLSAVERGLQFWEIANVYWVGDRAGLEFCTWKTFATQLDDGFELDDLLCKLSTFIFVCEDLVLEPCVCAAADLPNATYNTAATIHFYPRWDEHPTLVHRKPGLKIP